MLLMGIIGYLVLFTIFMLLALKFAPLGYEDKFGFHSLEKEKNKINKVTKKKVA